jgi:hypothetical protein
VAYNRVRERERERERDKRDSVMKRAQVLVAPINRTDPNLAGGLGRPNGAPALSGHRALFYWIRGQGKNIKQSTLILS